MKYSIRTINDLIWVSKDMRTSWDSMSEAFDAWFAEGNSGFSQNGWYIDAHEGIETPDEAS